MGVSQKCHYALRAVLELAKRSDGRPTKIADIAAAQGIPPKFLELILCELRQGGFVNSRRGPHGGYLMAAPPARLSVGEIIRFVDGPFSPVGRTDRNVGAGTAQHSAFVGLWDRLRKAVAGVYEVTTFQDIIEQEQEIQRARAANYCI